MECYGNKSGRKRENFIHLYENYQGHDKERGDGGGPWATGEELEDHPGIVIGTVADVRGQGRIHGQYQLRTGGQGRTGITSSN